MRRFPSAAWGLLATLVMSLAVMGSSLPGWGQPTKTIVNVRSADSNFLDTGFSTITEDGDVAANVFDLFLGNFPLTTQLSAWYSGISLAGILLMAAMAFYSFQTSLGARPMFGTPALDE